MNTFWKYKKEITNNSELANALKEDRKDMLKELESYQPQLLPDYDKVLSEISSAVNNFSRIMIFGDYDCDGITATTILYKFLLSITPFVSFFIPDRFLDGYGINMDHAKKIVSEDIADLIITVDNGITANEPVKYLKEHGKKVIITDHHTCLSELPEADAVVNCHREDSNYPFKDLCGAGVAFKLVQGLNVDMNCGYDGLLELLDLAALGTIADVVPLTDENRLIVSRSLVSLPNSSSFGIRAMIKNHDSLRTKASITAEDVAFSIAPMINAASRMGNMAAAIDLLNADSFDKAEEMARKLSEINENRKQTEAQITADAMSTISSQNLYNELTPIVVVKEGWHKGIIGITAAKLAEKFHCPVFIGTIEGDVIHGSARAYGDFNIIEALSSASDSLLSYGGHVGAGGFSLKKEQLEDFRSALLFYAYDNPWTAEEDKTADALIPVKGINLDLINSIEALGPFGEGNRTPVFMSASVKVTSIIAIGKDKSTLKMSVSDKDANILNCIGFSMASHINCIRPGDMINIVYRLSVNTYNGRSSAQAVLIDIEEPAVADRVTSESNQWSKNYSIHSKINTKNYPDLSKSVLCTPTAKEYSIALPIINELADSLILKNKGISICFLTQLLYIRGVEMASIAKTLRFLEAINETNVKKIIVTYGGDVYFANTPEFMQKIRVRQTDVYLYFEKSR